MAELTEERLIQILDNRLDEKLQRIDDRFLELPTKEDYRALKVIMEDIKQKVDRIDKRTDEDIRAVIKDVEKLKTKYA